MPSIIIQEDNLTRGTSAISTDIPFIPGFVSEIQYSYRKATSGETATHKYDSASKSYIETLSGATHVAEQLTILEKPVLCSSVQQFETIFGKDPYIFLEDVAQLGVNKGDPDRSYIMAKELLAKNMAVYYYGIHCANTDLISRLSTSSAFSEDDYRIVGNKIHLLVNNDLQDGTPDIVQHIYVTTKSKLNSGDIISASINSRKDINVEALDSSMQSITDSFESLGNGLYKCLRNNTSEIRLSQEGFVTYPAGSIISISVTRVKISTKDMLEKVVGIFDVTKEIADKDEYSIKYITSGGYANNIELDSSIYLYNKMIAVAAHRGDAIALVEDVNDSSKSLNPNSESFFYQLDSRTVTNGEYAAAFTPWANYILSVPYKDINNKTVSSAVLPACFGYLADLALNIKTSPNWLAMAGITRGRVPNIVSLHTTSRLSNTIANAYQPTSSQDGYKIALNAITDIKPYGLTIWGNRTLKTIAEEGLDATHFLNTRNMISDIKKVVYRAAKAQLFEQNSETLWLNFKSEVSPFLEQLKKGNGISDYKLLKLDTKYNGNSLGKEEFACAIKIYPLYAVESFEITVVVSDNDVSVG